MLPEALRPLSLFVLAAVTGCIGWSGEILLLPVALVFPAIWSLCRSRAQAALVSLSYFLAASRGLPHGVATFYSSDLWPGILLWLTASFGFVIVHSVLWKKGPDWVTAIRYLAACLIMAIPPFGILGWAHPLTAAGVIFSGFGWLGLAGTAAGLAILATRFRPAAAVVLAGFWLWSAVTWSARIPPSNWQSVDLQRGPALGRDLSREWHRDMIAMARNHRSGGVPTSVIVLPESALGYWTHTVEHLWRQGLAGTDLSVIAGAVTIDVDGYDNILVQVSRSGSNVLYRERMPVPGSMWQPWRFWLGLDGSARAHFFANPVVDFNGKRIAPLICYEQLILWPVLQSMMHDPDLIIAVGNGWWTGGTSIVAIQRASAEAWARLFNIPLLLSFNT